MRISSLTLTNFRSFNQEQTLELAPITLMFGPNNVGKSTVLMALAYIQQILQKGNCNPRYLDALGNKKVGGFYALVNGQDLNKTIQLRVKVEVGDTLLDGYNNNVWELVESLNNLKEQNDPVIEFTDEDPILVEMQDIPAQIKNFEVELEIAWSNYHNYAYVSRYKIWINDEYIGCINSSKDLKDTHITELNTLHHLLVSENQEEWFERRSDEIKEFNVKKNFPNLTKQLLDKIYNKNHDLWLKLTAFDAVLDQLNPNSSSSPEQQSERSQFINRASPISIKCGGYGAIPGLGKLLSSNLAGQDIGITAEYINYSTVIHTLTQIFVLPLDYLLKYLQSSISIGPLRIVPDIDYLPNPKPEQTDWSDGSAAWDELHKNPEKDSDTKQLIKKVNDWLESPDKLATEYHISNYSIKRAAEADKHIKPNSPIDTLLDMRHVAFEKGENRVFLLPNQLGTGFSQMIPIIVAANMEDKGLISIEQPELHIHPRLQVRIADLFLAATQRKNSKTSFLIETHSEHLILRLLRRVRETTANDKESKYKVFPNDLSVLYLSSTTNGVEVKRLNITADGDFHDRWPEGFFGERIKELF